MIKDVLENRLKEYALANAMEQENALTEIIQWSETLFQQHVATLGENLLPRQE